MMSHGPCNACRGKGQQSVGKCNGCQGRGLLPEEKSLEINVEPGMMSGNTVVFQGMCSDSQGFTEAGDVTIVLREADEEGDSRSWIREGTRLKTSITINLTEALLGTKKVLRGHPGFTNGVTVEIPAGVQNMWSGTMPGLGMPIRGTPKFGEAFISVLVIPTPEELAALIQQSTLLKSMLPQQPSMPESTDTVYAGRWSAL
jgi:DnaJ-class molecular chaperone